MRIRLAEIAERAGVSQSTVSRVLNDRAGVSQRARSSVLTAIDVLGYDRPARLRPRSQGLVGLVVPELDNPFFPRFARLCEHELARHRLTSVLCSVTLSGIDEDEYVEQLLGHGVSGIIFCSGVHAIDQSQPERYQRLVDRGLPIVLVNGYLPGVAAPSLSTDDVESVGIAVRHLATLGHRRIGLAVGQPRYTPVKRKVAGFRRAIGDWSPELSPQEVDALVETTVFTAEGGTTAAQRLVGREATAIVCGSDVMALGAVRGVRQLGLRVPEEISVVGYDDSPLMEFTDPPLTTVRQPAVALARAACDLLIDQIAGSPISVEEVLFRPELVVRASTAPAPHAPSPPAARSRQGAR